MHNLRNTSHTKFDFEGTAVSAIAWDVTDGSKILAFGPSAEDPGITLRRLHNFASKSTETKDVASWDAPSPSPDLAVDRILDLHYFTNTKTCCLVLAGGDIIVARVEPQPDEDLIEIVGSVDAGIKSARWSPDEELLAISTGANTVLLMTRAFESAANIELSADDLKVSNHVSVGWGKRETQFKGRGAAAKALRDPTVPEHVDAGTLSPFDDGRVTISWRGDGQYFAVNAILDVEPKRRIIRVYSRDGQLDSVSEPVNGLEEALSWKPSGQVIAGVQRHDDKLQVVFFERNGLRHGDFDLRLNHEDLKTYGSNIDLCWNVDSTVLAVSLKDRIQLWTMNNYHHYLKQEIRFDDGLDPPPPQVFWHPERPIHLSCVRGGEFRVLSYAFTVSRGPVTPPNDLGTVAVIDGKMLKVTPLRIANVPPPMAYDEINLPANALDIAINEAGNEIAVLHYDTVSLWSCDYAARPVKKATLIQQTDRSYTGTDDNLQYDALEKDGVSQPAHERFHTRTDHDRVFFHKRMLYPSESGEIEEPGLSLYDSLETTCHSGTDAQISFSLSDSGVLEVLSSHERSRVSGCTSFIVTPTHLVYTTNKQLLKFVHLHNGKLDVPPDEPEKDERCRSIERGAKIITIMPSAHSVVLQMPRGNLETIYPRALVLAGVRQSIRDRDYKTGFLICRTHRVDMNILHDFMPAQFKQHVGLFIKQMKNSEYIDLFLSSLSEDDVSQTLYKDTFAPTEETLTNGTSAMEPQDPAKTSKINRICDAFLETFEKQPSSRLQNIVTAHVRKSPPDLEAGLKLVSSLSSEADEARLEEAVEHICFLADVNRLYDTALGLYNLEVALLIAQQAQKDPREYLPYLEALNEMSPLRRQFTIDHDLQRHSKAIVHLHALAVFDELTLYAVKHDLYNVAIDLYRYDHDRLAELMRLYADSLSSVSKFKEAGIAYEYVSDHRSAYEAYRAVNMWEECLTSAAVVPLPQSEMQSLARDLSSSLEEAKDFKSAATIHLEHLDELEGAVSLLCKGYHFTDAMRQVVLRRQPQLLGSIIDPALIEASASMTETLSEMKSQLLAQVPRLRELRQRKEDDPMAFLDGADGVDGDIPDNLSLAPTDTSTTGDTFMTRYTNRSNGTLATDATRKTSKNRRREERKRARGKKGTVYEEEYLENSIARLVERLNDINGDVTELVQCLLRRGMRERAIAVEKAIVDIRTLCEGCMNEVFKGTSDNGGSGQHDGDGEMRPWGGQGVEWEALNRQRKEGPVLKPFNTLVLLHI